MSYVSKMLPVMLTVFSVAAQAQTTPYTANVVEDPNTGNYIKTNVVVVPELVEAHFGDKKVWVLGGGTSAVVAGQHQQLDGQKSDSLSLGLSLSAGQFVAKDFLLGMQGGVSATLINEASKTLLAQKVGPFAGYNVRMTEHSSFLPTLAVMYDFEQTWLQGDASAHQHVIEIELGLGFALNLTRHLNVVVGPYVAQSVYNHTNSHGIVSGTDVDVGADGNWITTYGLRASVLGWR